MSLTCPRCGIPLQERKRVGVPVDTCDRCRGVWLDRGELDRVLARLQELRDTGGRDPNDPEPVIQWGRLVRYPRRHPLRRLGRLEIYR